MTYNNVVKYDGKKDKSALPLVDDFVLFQACPADAATHYCAVEDVASCPTDAATATECAIMTDVKYALPVEDGFVVAFAKSKSANTFIDAVEDNEGDYVVAELALGGKLSKEGKTAMQVIYCIMFWVIFALVIATFVLALLSICQCGCCRCCNSIKGIFPRNQA